jgi:hypothetical protein
MIDEAKLYYGLATRKVASSKAERVEWSGVETKLTE